MKKHYLSLVALLTIILSGYSQFQLNTVPPLNGGNGSQGITFGITANQSLIIDTLFCSFSGAGLTDVWYTTTDVSGPPNISATTGWTQIGSATIPVASGTGSIVPIPLNIGVMIIPGVNYRFFINGNIGAAVVYTTGTAGVAAPFTDGVLTIETGNLVGYGGPPPSPANHPRQFNGGVKYSILGGMNDAAVLSIDSPGVFCGGPQPVYATIANFGANQISNVDVNWELNGVVQTPITYRSLLDTLNGSNPNSAMVFLGTTTFSPGPTEIKVYTSNPNGVADTSNFNDTNRRVVGPSIQGNFTINSGAAPSATNFTSFSAFASEINGLGVCGPIVVDVVSGSGPYNEQVEFNGIVGTDSSKTITINGHGETISFASASTNQRAVITVDNSSWISIDSLNVIATGGTYGFGVQFINQAHHLSVTNCTIDAGITNTSSNFAGVVMSGSRTSATGSGGNMHDILIENNEIMGGYLGISSYGNTASPDQHHITIRNNNIHDFYIYGNYILYSHYVDIDQNDISRAIRTTVSTFYGVLMSTGCTNSRINANTVHNISDGLLTSTSTAYPLYIAGDATAGNDNYITNNLLYNLNNSGVLYAIYNSTAEYSHIINNTISLDDVNTTSTSACRGVYYSGAAAGATFYNNIITISRGGTGIKHGIYLTGAIADCNYNDVYITAASGTNSYGFSTTDQANLSAWQTNTTFGANSHEVDPQYVDLANDDYEPRNGLINAVGLGNPAVTTDLFGNPRTANPDIGAIEFTPPASDNLGLLNLVSPVMSQDSCYGASEDVIVTVINAGGTILDFTSSNATLTFNFTGAVTTTLTYNLNNNSSNGGSPLAIGSTMDVTLGSISMVNSGNYNVHGLITMVTDTFPRNDTLIDTLALAPTSGGTINGPDTICMGDTVTISADNYQGQLQWQVNNGTGFTDILGADSTEITIWPSVITSYRVLACGGNSSDTLTVLPIVLAAPRVNSDTAIAASCNTAATAVAVATSANPNPQFDWYDAAVGGNKISTGGAYTISTNGDTLMYTATPTNTISYHDTVWVEEVTAGGAGGPTLLITEADPGAPDMFEIQNVSGSNVDVTGWTVAISNSYTDINNVNTIFKVLSGNMAPGQIEYWTDASTTNYWGNNILWNPGPFPTYTGWIIIIDNNGDIVDFVIWNWLAANIQAMNATINGFTVTPGASGAWIGDGINANGVPTGSSMYRVGNADNNIMTDFIVHVNDPGLTNAGLVTPFAGGGCASPRAVSYIGVECVVGIEDRAALENFSVRPNPSNGNFIVDLSALNGTIQLEVLDLSGKLVFNANATRTNSYKMELEGLTKGVYFLKVTNNNISKIEKLIIN